MERNKKSPDLYKSTLVVFFILFIHVLLIGGLGCLVLFFRGIAEYFTWIALFGSISIAFSAFYFIRKFKRDRTQLGAFLNSEGFRGRSVEINILGGVASIKIDNSKKTDNLLPSEKEVPQLEDPAVMRIRELTELAKLLENNLITLDEYNRTKQDLFN